MEINWKGLTIVYSNHWTYDSWGTEYCQVEIDEIYHEDDKEHKFDLVNIFYDNIEFDDVCEAMYDYVMSNT